MSEVIILIGVVLRKIAHVFTTDVLKSKLSFRLDATMDLLWLIMVSMSATLPSGHVNWLTQWLNLLTVWLKEKRSKLLMAS